MQNQQVQAICKFITQSKNYANGYIKELQNHQNQQNIKLDDIHHDHDLRNDKELGNQHANNKKISPIKENNYVDIPSKLTNPTTYEITNPRAIITRNQPLIVDLIKKSNLTSCFHLNYLIEEAPGNIKNFRLKFKILCQHCVSDITTRNAINELIIALDTTLENSFRRDILEQAIFMLWSNPNEILLRPIDFENFKNKFIDMMTTIDDEPQLFRNLLWLLNVIPSGMAKLIPKYRLCGKTMESHDATKRKINKENVKIILISLRNLSSIAYQNNGREINQQSNMNSSKISIEKAMKMNPKTY